MLALKKSLQLSILAFGVLLVLFLSIGFIRNHSSFTTEVLVSKSRDDVFKHFLKVENLVVWLPHLKKIKTLNQAKGEFLLFIENRDTKTQLKYKLYSNKKDFYAMLNISGSQLLQESHIYFHNIGDKKTKLIINSKISGKGIFFKSMLAFLESSLKKKQSEHYQNFKKFSEKQ